MASREEPKRRRIKPSGSTKERMFGAATNGSLESFKQIVLNPTLGDEQRKTLLNSMSYDGWTVLNSAAQHNRSEIITWLLSDEGRAAGFDSVLMKSNHKHTVLHFAAHPGHFECFKAIVNGCREDNGERHEMLNAVDDDEWTVLHHAAFYGGAQIIAWLLSDEEGGGRAAGFDSVLAKSNNGRTALHFAAQLGHFNACQAIVNGCRVDNGERHEMLNAVCDDEWTVLHQAADSGRAEIITWLLFDEEGGGRAAGFDSVLAKSNNGHTALHFAAQHGHLECCQAIVDGCRVDNGERHEMLNAVCNDGRTVLHYAAHYGRAQIIKWILTEGVEAGFDRKNITVLTKNHSLSALHLVAHTTADAIQALLSQCSSQERMNLFLCVDSRGWTTLHHAAQTNNADVVSEFLRYPECSLIVNRNDNCGMTVLHRAIIGGLDEKSRKEWSHYFKPNANIVKALLGSSIIDPNIGLCLQ